MFVPVIFFIISTHLAQCQPNDKIIEVTLKNGSQFFEWWAEPPVRPVIKFYIYSVTNVDEFFVGGAKPVLKELGPYVYVETWKKKNVMFHENGTVSFNPEKIYRFDELLSNGSEDDEVVVPNVSMLRATSQSKHSAEFIREAMATIFDVLKMKPFVEVTVKQLLWGYEDPLLRLGNGILPEEQRVPYNDEYGLMINKNGTSTDTVTIFTEANDVGKLGLIDRWNGYSRLSKYTSDKCNNLMASDGFMFPPHLTKNSTIHVYEKDWCKISPMVFEKEVENSGGILTYRFTPLPENSCYPPSTPLGFFNASLCQFGSPILLSFPHFYLANDSYRTVFDGITPPDPEKHKFYIDVQPTMGVAMSAKTRLQMNLAVSHVEDIEQVAGFPDIIFPLRCGMKKDLTAFPRT